MRVFSGVLVVVSCLAWCAEAQTAAGAFQISGTVTDPSGAGIPSATVMIRQRGGAAAVTAHTDNSGQFRAPASRNGSYDLDVQSEGFQGQTVRVNIKDRSPAPLRIELKLAGVRQQVTVSGTAAQVSTEAADNLDVVTLDRQMLDNLPVFDQNYVTAMSQFLDPGSIGTGGVTLVVNGMEQKNIGVSASAIQEVKINQNPYSAEFFRPGRGRIEVITKPSSQSYHGTFDFLFRDAALNARDPFALSRPPEQRRIYEGSLVGPLGRSKKNSFLISVDREELDNQAVIFAYTPNGVLQQTASTPQRDTEIAGAVTHQFSENHLATIRGTYHNSTQMNSGVGGFVLPEAGVNLQDREDEIMYNDSLTITPRLINQFRIIVGREHQPSTSITDAPAIVVPGSFTGGGAQADRLQTENHTQFNDILSWSKGKHSIRTGINVPDISRRGLDDYTNFGGTYSFSTLADYSQQSPYSFIQQQGDGHVVFLEMVMGGFFQDDYRLRPNLTISAGVRYDWQNYFHDYNNVAPRLAIAYGVGKNHKTIVRAGSGIFYDRTGAGPIFDLERYNGVRLRQIVLSDPSYPAILDPASLAAMPTTITRLDPTGKLPYLAQFSTAVERQISKGTTVSATYWGSRGVGLFRSRDVNAPPPPDYVARPNPNIGVYRQIESSGHLESNALELDFRGRLTRYFQGMIQYTLGRAYNNVPGNYAVSTRGAGINAFPANDYDLSGEWARSDYDQRDRLNLLGTTHAAKYLDFGVGLSMNTGMPYTETTGMDNYHTGYANARPPGVPRNSLQGPGFAELDLRWWHEFLLTRQKEGPRFTIAVDAFNATNRVNYVTYVGDLSSPFFGQAVAAKAPRRLQLSGRFEF